ncbi:MAG: phosphoribosylformylglycinamidine synthase subunit PurQ [SAR202 cluster bacterium]|nr:phosphoribosylformylglycinamidine synthase subunit PurQ [SAR202 cluster bacterium]|tara:strand:- start:11831 stop:12520 length:690 start_codon:yes stop_codon:yes gene_type:complete
MRFGIVVFPGTWSDGDCYHVTKSVLGQDSRYIWHTDTDLSDIDCVVLPGGFSYGDYLRTGSIARFSPVMHELQKFVNEGRLVIGICNGFQILCESGMLPGALIRNNCVQFRCEWVNLRVEDRKNNFVSQCETGQILRVPISHGEGNYYADQETINSMLNDNQIVFRYCNEFGEVTAESNPNGSLNNIAGIINKNRNVLGMMPHPERCCEAELGGKDGLYIFESIIKKFS